MLGRRLARIHRRSAPTQARGETFIALRACRRAWELARGLHLSHPVDVTHLYCQACGAGLDCSNWNDPTGPRCPSCGEAVRVPGYIRGSVRTLNAEEENWARRHERVLYGPDDCPDRQEHLDDQHDPDDSDDATHLTETAALVRLARSEGQSLEKVEWTFLKVCTILVLTFMALGALLFICLFLFAFAVKSSAH